jgi:hypothetical protein
MLAAIISHAYTDMLLDDRRVAEEAMLFLTTRTGGVAVWRRDICSLLDIDGDIMADRVRAQLDGDADIPHGPEAQAVERHNARVARARERWCALKKRRNI